MAHGAILGQKLEDALLVDGSKSMQANLNMNNNKITNVANGTANTDIATVGQLNAAVANNVGAIIEPSNNIDRGLVLGSTCIYIWSNSTGSRVFTIYGDEYDIVNSWYNLSGLYSKGLTELPLLATSGVNTTSIGDVEISQNKLNIRIRSTYCGFAYFQTFKYVR